jgi:hypothetical protein
MIEDEEEINLNIWNNIKSLFQKYFPTKNKTLITKENRKIHLETKGNPNAQSNSGSN